MSRTRTRIEGFVLAPPLRGLEGLSMRMALQSMGLKDVKADFDCYGTEDQGKGELTLDRCALVSPGLGEIELSARIVNADAIFWNALDEGDLLALAGLDGGAGRGPAGAGRQEPAGARPARLRHRDRPAGRDAARQPGRARCAAISRRAC